MKRFLYATSIVLASVACFAFTTSSSLALEAENSTSVVQDELQVTTANANGYQNQVSQLQQALDSAVLQADQIERSFLAQYKNDTDLIVGTYSYGSLHNLKLTKQQAEIIKNGAIPFLGNPGDAATVNKNPKTNVEYAEIDGGGSGGRSITACYNPYVPRKPGENQVLVKGSMHGSSNGGYVCADPANIKMICSTISESNPCLNGMYQLDNSWLLSIGVDTADIRRQIEARSTPPPTQPVETPAPNEPEPQS